MNEHCPYPPIRPIEAPVEEICYMQVKKSKDLINQSLSAYGEGNSEAVIHCYVEALTKTKRGDVETTCTKEAVVEGWEALTQKTLDELVGSADNIIDGVNEDGQKFEFNAENEVTRFDAK